MKWLDKDSKDSQNTTEKNNSSFDNVLSSPNKTFNESVRSS